MDKNLLYFHHACVVDDVETLVNMLEFEEDIDINSADDDGDTGLHKAVLFKNYDSAKYLLDMGCAKNKKNSYGWTALDMAIVNRDKYCIKLLLNYGLDEFVADKKWFMSVYND